MEKILGASDAAKLFRPSIGGGGIDPPVEILEICNTREVRLSVVSTLTSAIRLSR
jgi:hypothetical protein